ncbi:VOC family protein [Streptomyces mutabilis]|uniref:VOC family protein n=1 Tax=Streptomyces mutabilis TaxID=67332 RepID=UPI001783824F|nr:VOC family protein [Streptomyces mutabilis]GGQ12972.1 glyoxalase [Streptomyces mutabilis]
MRREDLPAPESVTPSGEPTPDEPDVTPGPPSDAGKATGFLDLRVADIERWYREWSVLDAEFLTTPICRKAEIRCCLRAPDAYPIEVGQATGMLEGVVADPPAGQGLRRRPASTPAPSLTAAGGR